MITDNSMAASDAHDVVGRPMLDLVEGQGL